MQIKTVITKHYSPTRVAKIEKIDLLSVEENVEQLELSCSVSRTANWHWLLWTTALLEPYTYPIV